MSDAFVPYPLRLSFGVRRYAFGTRLIESRLGKEGLPDGIVAETWEVSDHPDEPATVQNGAYSGRPLRELVQAFPDQLVRAGWRGPHLPLLVKLLDASHLLPVHAHPADAVAAARYGEPNGKDEAWHVLWAEPGASVLVGLQPGLERAALRDALLAQDYDAALLRYPVQTGDTVDVPGGVLHTFGPDTLILEVQQTSDLGESAMPHDLYGRPLTSEAWHANVDATLGILTSEARPRPDPGVVLRDDEVVRRVQGCRNARFVLERWTLRSPLRTRVGEGGFATLTALDGPLTVTYDGGSETLPRASSCLLPAAIGEVTLEPVDGGPLDVVVCFEPGQAQPERGVDGQTAPNGT